MCRASGEAFDCDVAVVGVGVAPEVAWLAGSGIAIANGILVDEYSGTHVAAHALQDGPLLALSVEKNGQDEFDFEYGQDFGAHVETFDPAFTKVTVRYNPDGDAGLNARQMERLAHLTDWLQQRGRRFLLQLRVPPTQAQLDATGGDRERYDTELRPSLLVRAMGGRYRPLKYGAPTGFNPLALPDGPLPIRSRTRSRPTALCVWPASLPSL